MFHVAGHRLTAGRRLIVTMLTALTFLGALAACTGSSTGTPHVGRAGSPQRPNIVFILTDDLSNDLLQYMPHVRALAEQGTSFSHYYVVDSLCCPSRAAIFTGMYPHDDGVFRNVAAKAGNVDDAGYAAFEMHNDEHKTYATSLHAADYRTAMMGKYLNGYAPHDPVPLGWDEWDVGGVAAYKEYDYSLNQDGIQVQYGHNPADYLTTVLSHRASSVIDDASRSKKPFAMEVATFAPHLPATPAPRFAHSFPNLRAPHGPAWDTLPTDPPSWLAKFPKLSRADIANINNVYRRRVRSVQSVDELVANLERQAACRSRDEEHLLRVQLRQRLPHRSVPAAAGQADRVRHRHPRAADRDRAGGARGSHRVGAHLQHRPHPDLRGPGRRETDRTGRRHQPDVAAARFARAAGLAAGRAHRAPRPGLQPQGPRLPELPRRDPQSYEAVRTAGALFVEYRDGEQEYYDTRTDPNELHNLASTPSAAPAMAAMHLTEQALARCHGTTQCQAAANTS